MGAVVSELLVEALARRSSSRARPSFRWTSREMNSLVDLSTKTWLMRLSIRSGGDPHVNVLLYASDRSSDRHVRARRFVASCEWCWRYSASLGRP